MILFNIAIYIIVGVASGVLAGLLGIGGGIIIVPALFFIFKYLVPNVQHSIHLAIGTSLAIISIASLASMYLYQKRHAIYWPMFKHLFPGLIAGSILGVIINTFLPGKVLTQFFAIFAFLFGLYFLIFKKTYKSPKKPKQSHLLLGGFVIGTLATLLGVGGGVIALPFFIMIFRCPNYCLIGNASTATFITSIVGTLCFIISGFSLERTMHTFGNIYIPAFVIIGVVSIFSVYLGIKLADRLHVRVLKRIFAVALIATSVFMFFK